MSLIRIDLSVVCTVLLLGCGGPANQQPAAPPIAPPAAPPTAQSAAPRPTLPLVRELLANQLGVAIDKITPTTTLKDLGADELDLVELVMELEEEFKVYLPDEDLEKLASPGNGVDRFSVMSVQAVADLVDQRRANPIERPVRPANDPTTTYGQYKRQAGDTANASESQVPVFLNPLVMLLAGRERQKGSPLTRDEVLAVRDGALCIVMTKAQAEKFYQTLDLSVPVHRIDPERCWEEWQEVRGKLE